MKYNDKKNDQRIDFIHKIIRWFFIAILVLYVVIPPYDKFAQLSYIYHNYKVEQKDYIYHRNSAVYYLRMNKKDAAMKEINIALELSPKKLNDPETISLYNDRAFIELYFKDYKRALSDYLKVNSNDSKELFRIAMLYKKLGDNNSALTYCNKIIDRNVSDYIAYLCFADVYAGVNKYDVSVGLFDILINRSPNKYIYYLDRADYKELSGDKAGAAADRKKARDLCPIIGPREKLSVSCINPNPYQLQIKK